MSLNLIQENWFKTEGLELAKNICNQEQTLKCCGNVSEAVVKKAKKVNIDCEVKYLRAYSQAYNFKWHSIIFCNGTIIDYTQQQFFGEIEPDYVRCDVISNYFDISGITVEDDTVCFRIYTNNHFDMDLNQMDYSYMIDGLDEGTIICTDNEDYILYIFEI